MKIALVLLTAILAQGPARDASRSDPDLASAAKLADVRRVRELVLGGAAVDMPDRRGYTPLMWAAAGGSTELTTFLLERGARADNRAGDGTTALYLAAANGAVDVVKLLLARGADPSAARDGRTPRQAALARGQADVAALLAQAEAAGVPDRGALPVATSSFARPTAPAITDTLRAMEDL